MQNRSKMLVVVITLGFMGYCAALQCYVCNSQFQKDCNDIPVPDKYLVTCNSTDYAPDTSESNNNQSRLPTTGRTKFNLCRKVIIKVPQQENGAYIAQETSRSVRSCGYLDKGRNGCTWGNNHGIQSQMCECDKDGCNSAHKTFTPTILSLVFVALAASFYNNNK